jgi:hypothetical protein
MTDEERTRINLADLEKINASADYFNEEMEDVLRYQAEFDDSLFAETLDAAPEQ